MKYYVKRVEPEKYRSDILELWTENFNSCQWPDNRFNWLYNECPNGSVKTWLLFSEEGEVVGSCSLLPRNLYVKGLGTIPSWTAIDLAVKKEHRSLGPALKLVKSMTQEALKGECGFLIGHPNKNAEGLFKRVGFKSLGVERTWCKVVHSGEKLEKRISNTLLQKLITHLLDASQTLHLNILRTIFRRNLTFKHFSTCDSSFDLLWEKTKDSLDVALERSSDYLNWRFCHHADRAIQIMAACNSDGSIAGYIAFSVENESAIVEDLFVIDHFSTKVNLYVLFCLYARKKGFKTIIVTELCSESNSYLLRRLFFFKYNDSERFNLKVEKREDGIAVNSILENRRWDFCGDFDV